MTGPCLCGDTECQWCGTPSKCPICGADGECKKPTECAAAMAAADDALASQMKEWDEIEKRHND